MPDIEWRVKDEAGEQTIAKTPDRSARWPWNLLALIVVIGAGLGIAYTNIKDPAPLPTPTPTLFPTPVPTLTPLPLTGTIEREALALAEGDRSTFLSLQDLRNHTWYQSQQKNFETWGAPAGGSRPYEILDSGQLPDGVAWAEVDQYRSDRYFRETRFYRVLGGVWVRTTPELSFWGSAQSLDTVHFHVTFADRDRELAQYVIFRFEDAYERLCGDLNCPQQRDCVQGLIDNLVGCSYFPRVMTLTVQLDPAADRSSWLSDRSTETITLPSPRVMGVYNRWWSENDPIENVAYQSLLTPITRLASGDLDRWNNDLGGFWFAEAVVDWELQQVVKTGTGVQRDQAQAFYSNLLADVILIPLDTDWTWHVDQDPSMGANNDRGQIEAEAVIAYIDQTYGPDKVVQFLNALGPAKSTADAIQIALNMKFADFNQGWLKWLGRE